MNKLKKIGHAKPWKYMPKISREKNAAYTYRWGPSQVPFLPEHYRKKAIEFLTTDPTPVHYLPQEDVGKLKYNEMLGKITKVQDTPIPIIFPEEANEGLWGGEGIIQGFKPDNGKGRQKGRIPKLWKPFLVQRAVYSEILDKWFKITMTLRVLDLIDDAMGFDNYILRTHERDLNSLLAMKLRREMLLALANKTCYPDNAEKQQMILKKYADCIIPIKEAEYIGLTVQEVVEREKEKMEKNKVYTPLKDVYTDKLIQKLQLMREGKWVEEEEEEGGEEEESPPEEDDKLPVSRWARFNPLSTYNRDRAVAVIREKTEAIKRGRQKK